MGRKKSNKKEFVEKAKEVHKDKYSYDKFDYKGSMIKGTITCEKHGNFEQTPSDHLSGRGCPKCAVEYRTNLNRSNLEEFIEKANKIHNKFYDYSKADYIHSNKKVKIICPIHGVFKQTPSDHLSGCGCPKCAVEKLSELFRSNLQEFVEKAKKVHNNFYDYSMANYINSYTKIKIICPIHGVFEQTPSAHLSGNGCPKCANEKLSKLFKSNSEEFVENANKIHNNFYDYSNVDYINSYTKIKIICPIHGVFEQTPSVHLSGCGCPKCWKEKLSNLKSSNLEEFVEKSNKIHNNFYNYSNVDYINSRKKIKIICPIHGVFEQTPSAHLSGNGCPKCWRERLRELQNIKWSDRFDEGILYLIECWNDVERFVKIGITSRSVEERYKQNFMPYNYSILKEIYTDSNTVSDTEQHIINFYESYKPSIPFAGDSECLSIDEKYQIIEYLENLEKDLEVS